MDMKIRSASPDEIATLADLWFAGWQDAHARILPEALARARTLESFRERLASALDDVRVGGEPGSPLGLSMTKGDELNQLYVARSARGTGLAAALVAEAEARLRDGGVDTAWLACAIGNDRAARFYEKQGWRRIGVVTSRLETPEGPFDLDVWRYEKRLTRA